jgi:hypothetical protein
MALVHNVAQRNVIADAMYTELGSGFNLIFTDVSGGLSGTVLATMTHNASAPSAAAAGVKDFFSGASSLANETSAAAGTALGFRLETSGAAVKLSGIIGTDGINLSSSSIGAGDTVSISALTYAAPA